MAEEREQRPFDIPPSQVVGSFTTYDEAERAVDFLAERGFPVEQVAIVAGDLRFVEQVTGRRGYGAAAIDGAASGAVTGALLGFILGVLTLVTPLTSGITLALWGLVIGAVIGTLVGLLAHALSSGRRDFTSVPRLDARRYDLVTAATVADRARRLLEDRRLRAAA